MNWSRFGSISVVIFALATVSHVHAQAPYLAKGNQEINAFGGLSYGLDHWRGSFGGNYAIAPFDKYVMLYGEYSYFPGIERTFKTQSGDTGAVSFQYQDIHGGVHIRLPIFPEKRIVPYLAGGLGWLRSDGEANVLVQQGNTTVRIPVSLTTNSFGVNGGGGIRFYLTGSGRFGFRLEAKVYKPVGSATVSSDPFGKISLGIFYQLK